MIFRFMIAFSLAGSLSAFAAPVSAQTAAPATKPAFSTADSDIGTLLDNPQTKAIVDAAMPNFSTNPQVDMARSMTLKQVQGFSNGAITDETLAKIDAQLAKVPAKK